MCGLVDVLHWSVGAGDGPNGIPIEQLSSWAAHLKRARDTEWRHVTMRQVREEYLLIKEVRSMEEQYEEIDATSGCKRLRAERNELREKLSQKEHMVNHFAKVISRLRTERSSMYGQGECPARTPSTSVSSSSEPKPIGEPDRPRLRFGQVVELV